MGNFDKIQLAFESAKEDLQQFSEEVKKQEEFLQTVSTGISGKEGRENGYTDQIEGNHGIV